MRSLRLLPIGLSLFLLAALAISLAIWLTESQINQHHAAIRSLAQKHVSPVAEEPSWQALPPPVRRYLDFALPQRGSTFHLIELSAAGDFRRPQTEGFSDTTAEQTIAVNTPALMFAASTSILPGLWARAYDFFADGQMEMKAKILSALTVVDEQETQALNQTSLRRWLLESPLYPMALLPGGPVRWQAINDHSARAIVSGFGLEASMVATFNEDGSLAHFRAEEDGDLTTPYHGSGEYAARSDYRLVEGMMIPHQFEIARIAEGKIMPFWKGQITSIEFR